MATNRAMRKALALVKVQAAKGVMEDGGSAPTAAANAIPIEVPANFVQYQHSAFQPNNVSGALDQDESIPTGMFAVLTLSALLKGSGVAGTAPEIGVLLRACGWAETVFETPITAEACGSGGSTTTAELGATAGTTDDLYLGAPVSFTEAVALDTFIADYAGSSKIATLAATASGAIDETVDYAIPAHVKYLPASASIPWLTVWIYVDGKVFKFFDCQGSFDLDMTARQPGRLNFTLTGLPHTTVEADASLPTGAVYDNTAAQPWQNGKMIHERVAIAVNSFRFSNGNSVQVTDDPNQPEGYGSPLIANRKLTATLDPQEELVATTDHIGLWRTGTKGPLLAALGASAGNRAAILLPAAKRVDPPGIAERGGLATRSVNVEAAAPDQGAAIVFY